MEKTEQGHTQRCVLYDRDCIGCLECETCDLVRTSLRQLRKCLDIKDVVSIKIDKIYTNPEEYEEK